MGSVFDWVVSLIDRAWIAVVDRLMGNEISIFPPPFSDEALSSAAAYVAARSAK